jgi:uncharacterized membrane protein
MPIDRSSLGPVEILAVAFPGNEFKGEIVPALAELVEAGLIRVLDLAFVGKDDDGSVTMFELSELGEEAQLQYASLGPLEEALVNDEDIAGFGEQLPPGNSAALLVWEDRWAKKLVDAIRNANGVLMAHTRVPHEAVEEVLDALASA